MPQNFIECQRDQPFLMPPDLRDWLPGDHLVWTVLDAVQEMDLAAFYGAYRSDGHGRPAYEPSMVVALLLYGYARGLYSSRAVERACLEDIAFRVIAVNQRPHHATIARFVARHEEALAGVDSPQISDGATNSDLPAILSVRQEPGRVFAELTTFSTHQGLSGERGKTRAARRRTRPAIAR